MFSKKYEIYCTVKSKTALSKRKTALDDLSLACKYIGSLLPGDTVYVCLRSSKVRFAFNMEDDEFFLVEIDCRNGVYERRISNQKIIDFLGTTDLEVVSEDPAEYGFIESEY